MSLTPVYSPIPFYRWLPFYDRGEEVGEYHLLSGIDNHLKREIVFKPLNPIKLADTKIGKKLVEQFSRQNLRIDPEGAIHVRLGPNFRLERVSKQIARAYNTHDPS